MDLKSNVKVEEPAVGTAQERQKDIHEQKKARELLEHEKAELAKKEAYMRKLMTDIENRRRENEEKRKAKLQQESDAIAVRQDLPPEVKDRISNIVAREGKELSAITQRIYEQRKAAIESQIAAASMHAANEQGGPANQERTVLHTSKELMADIRAETANTGEQVHADTPSLQQAA